MNNRTLSLIHAEEANTIYADAIRKARRLRTEAETVRKLADALDGAYITIRLEKKLSEVFPAYRVHVYKDSYSTRKFVSLHQRNADTYTDDWTIYLHNGDDNRANAEPMRKRADELDAEADALEKSTEKFFSIVGQYNAIATAYAGIYKELHNLIPDMVYADWNLTR